MSIADWDDFESEALISSSPPSLKCKVCTLLDDLQGDQREKLARTLDRPQVSASAIRTALLRRVDEAKVPSIWGIRYHRRGECLGRRQQND